MSEPEPEVVSLGRERQRRAELEELRRKVDELQAENGELRQRLPDPVDGATVDSATFNLNELPTKMVIAGVEQEQKCPCIHRGVYVDEKHGRVTCQACGDQLDPIQVLLWYSNKERRFMHHLDATKAELVRLEREVAARRKELESLKGKIRRATQQAPKSDLESQLRESIKPHRCPGRDE